MESILTDAQFFAELSQLVGGAAGATSLGVALLAVKALVLAFRWRLGNVVGLWRLAIVSGLTLVAGVVAAMANGVPFMGALLSAGTLSMASVFINQVYKQWQKYREDKARVAPAIR